MSDNSKTLKIVHTSDWHLGRSLYDHKRYEEFGRFLEWMVEFISTEKIDILLVAGDIFDTTTPGNRAQELYYQFLSKVSQSGCRHMVIIGGNHDSPTFLNAPKELLLYFNVHVVGAMNDDPEEEVILLKNESSLPEAIICAVPYLRDKDIRRVEVGENMEDKNQKLIAGITEHYDLVGRIAIEKQNGSDTIPIIGMGHLFTSGGKTTDGDGVRELYVGGLAHLNENNFPECFNYLALGHLHIAQKVGKSEQKRYSGSPIPMGFGEAGQQKKVIVIEFDHLNPTITEHSIPCFQELKKIKGNHEEIISEIEKLKTAGSNAWLEIDYNGSDHFSGISDMVNEAIADTGLEVLRIKNRQITELALMRADDQETLDDLDQRDVFKRCLDAHEIEEPDRSSLLDAYDEIILSYRENDSNAV